MKQHYIEIIWYKALAELRAESARVYLGFLWWVVEPILYMAAFYVVFGLIFQRGGEHFIAFLLCGLVVWKWFGSTLSSSANTIPANAGLMGQVDLPKYLFPAIVVVINSIKFSVIFVLLLVFLMIYGLQPTLAWLSLPLLIFIELILITAISGFVAAVVPFIPDFRLLLDNILMLLFFLSGIFFDISTVDEGLRSILLLNPVAVIIEAFRAVLIDGQWPDWRSLGFVLLFGVLGLWVTGKIYKRYNRVYPKVLI